MDIKGQETAVLHIFMHKDLVQKKKMRIFASANE